MKWIVSYSRKAAKQYDNLSRAVQDRLDLLTAELELLGPNRYNWKNYSKLEGTPQRYHCHIKKGKPTYVAVWEVIDDRVRLLEVTYVGTHEKAPY
ncbi:cytotoxic translational repressor of toxin-antitoxin stability system [Geomonas paludis]|uniref:Cytotoxic translational repressor of toxin-antitoxin stability system n=1 Tax=Geomonas paludis TaxID=2740185 RepID=A0ABY4LJU5_9BACT|nr:cytotoxic translational repressor of toxin-antitoxin stability system [Geomonas paludis]UPU37800.1 cytotoxic translational repressor of toxin-antitoxin stability system [Geomonas paludis]